MMSNRRIFLNGIATYGRSLYGMALVNVKLFVSLLAASFAATGFAKYKLELAQCYYGGNPVLQHGVTNCLPGRITEDGLPVRGVCVQARINGFTSIESTPSDEAGIWYSYLPPMPPQANPKPLVLSVNGEDLLAPAFFLVGDVWLCGGQSNMATRFSDVYDYEAYLGDATSDIGVFGVAVGVADAPQRLNIPGGHWAPSTSYTGAIPAVPFFFARALRKSGVDVPIGVVNVAVSGKRIETFMSPDMVAFDPDLSNEVAQVVEVDGVRGFQHWNAMYEPFRYVKFKGMIWYQGEANTNLSAEDYARRLSIFIRGVRKVWGSDLPFYSVQLASYSSWQDLPEGQREWPSVREGQFLAFSRNKNTGLAVADDLFASDAHPKAKVLIADRLARFARNGVYGQKVEAVGPIVDRAEYLGREIRVSFKRETIGCGLVLGYKDWRNNDEPVPAVSRGIVTDLNGFAISADNMTWHWAQGYIATDNSLVLSSTACADPKYVHYSQLNCNVGWLANGKVMVAGGINLYAVMRDSVLLPAFPFQTIKATPAEDRFPPPRDYSYVPRPTDVSEPDVPPDPGQDPNPGSDTEPAGDPDPGSTGGDPDPDQPIVSYDCVSCGLEAYSSISDAYNCLASTPSAWLVLTANDSFVGVARVGDIPPQPGKLVVSDSNVVVTVGNAIPGVSYGLSCATSMDTEFLPPRKWTVARRAGVLPLVGDRVYNLRQMFLKVIAK